MVQNLVAHERDEEADQSHDDDAQVPAQASATHSGQGLPRKDSRDDRPARCGCEVEQGHKHDCVAPEAVTSLDNLTHASEWSEDAECCWRDGGQEREEQYHKTRGSEAQAHEQSADEAGGRAEAMSASSYDDPSIGVWSLTQVE